MKNSKLLILFILLLGIQFSVYSQKTGIALGTSSNPARLLPGDVAAYETAALTGMRGTSLCNTLERSEWEKILKEKNVQQTEDFLDGKIIPQSVSLGAEYLLLLSFQGNDLSESTARAKDRTTKSLNMELTLGIKLVSVGSGEVEHSKVITMKESSSVVQDLEYSVTSKGSSNPFRGKMISNIEKELSNFTYEVFPPKMSIVKISKKSKRGKAKSVYCKTNAKFSVGTRLDIYTEDILELGDGENEIISNKVGELKVTAIKSDTIVECKVVKGAKKVVELQEAKTPLKCRPNFRTGMFDGVEKLFKN